MYTNQRSLFDFESDQAEYCINSPRARYNWYLPFSQPFFYPVLKRLPQVITRNQWLSESAKPGKCTIYGHFRLAISKL